MYFFLIFAKQYKKKETSEVEQKKVTEGKKCRSVANQAQKYCQLNMKHIGCP
jgi:hypothetical protein